MQFAAYAMSHNKKREKINSRTYAYLKRQYAELGPWNKGRHDLPPSWIKGKHHTKATRKKISKKCKGISMPQSAIDKTR